MNKPYTVLYEDENYLIVNKPSGLVVHKNKHENVSLISQIILDRGESHYLIHRIDKYTSGVVLTAKNRTSLSLTQELFLKNQVNKEYLTIVSKELPAKKLKITLSLGRSKSDKLKFSNRNAKNYKPAHTEVEVIAGNFARVFIKTGRTHQIRAHLSSISCPILNDPIYNAGNVFDRDFGQYLHAYKISFECPITGKNILVKADLPDEFLSKLRELNINWWEQ